MGRRRNTRINTLFAERTYDWLQERAEERNQSMAQVVRDMVEQARKQELLLERIEHLEKVIRKSHAVIVERIEGNK